MMRTLTTSTSPYSDPSHAIFYATFDRPERSVACDEAPGGRFVHPAETVQAEIITVGDEEISDVLDSHFGTDGWSALRDVADTLDPPEENGNEDSEPPTY